MKLKIKSIKLILYRFIFWIKTFRILKGITFYTYINMFLSLIIDILNYTFSERQDINPKLFLKKSCVFREKETGLVIVVRGATDDFFHALPGREGDVEEFIIRSLKDGDVFVDVGANIGYYSIRASRIVGERGRVYAFEPIPSTTLILKVNLKLNQCSNVVVYEKAAWSEDIFYAGRRSLTLRFPAGEYGLASAYGSSDHEVEVEAITLDEALKNVDHIDLLKIDVEGAELNVLKGSSKILFKTKKIVIEISRNHEEILRLLKQYGFQCRKAKLAAYYICEKTENA